LLPLLSGARCRETRNEIRSSAFVPVKNGEGGVSQQRYE
jgi:hypothetical protein